jgi:hypothetical protein
MLALASVGAFGIVIILAYAARDWRNFLGIASHGLLVAGASVLIGGFVGFIFGIPRTLQGGGEATPEAEARGVAYRPNTNLEQISDWLTKILVGIGLIQLGKAPAQLARLADSLAPGFGNASGSESFALTVVLYFAVSGFLFGFLWTRLFLPGAFRVADLALIDQRITERVDEQNARDVRALSLIDRQLNPGPDVPLPNERELIDAITAASAPVKVQIFQRAQATRSANWKRDPDQMDLVIPIFRALIASDPDNRFHRNHGQLGYALKDRRPPDWRGAEEELSKAIDIRGDWRARGWLFYEFNRAICRIALDEMFQEGRRSEPPQRDAILADLRAAANSDQIHSIIRKEPMITDWLRINEISVTELRR